MQVFRWVITKGVKSICYKHMLLTKLESAKLVSANLASANLVSTNLVYSNLADSNSLIPTILLNFAPCTKMEHSGRTISKTYAIHKKLL